ncbi:hypothetical protein BDV93DRAFT_605994 [Ceratobasidium sp. AG-I]|nr:hypothetical protein BDV93DRAFT_605994 [Ceratobasidium sp. AG-I]
MNMTPLTPPPERGQYPSSDECYEKIDALVDNVSVGDLRVILRHLLASSDVSTSERFCYAAQSHLLQSSPKPLPAPNSLLLFASPPYPDAGAFDSRGDTRPSPLLYRLASRTRMLYASGLLREAIQTILCIVQTSACPSARWWEGSDLAELYRRIDEDIVCVISMAMDHVQGLRQAMSALRTPTPSPLRGARKLPRPSKSPKRRDDGESAEDYLDLIVDLGTELGKIRTIVAQWNGTFPFQKGMSALAFAASRA